MNINKYKLPKKLITSGVFTWRQASKAGLTQYVLNKLIKEEQVEKLSHGVYRSTEIADYDIEAQYKAALLSIGKPAAICLSSALEFYGITDQIPKKVWVMVPAKKYSKRKGIRLWRRRHPKWSVGVVKNNEMSVTTIERTLVECLCNPKLVGGIPTVIQSIHTAIENKYTNLDKVLKMADKLDLKNNILTFVEVLSA